MNELNVSSFEKALISLDSIIIRYKNDNYDVDIRDAVIQRFEYTYSLAVKMMTRFINLQSAEAKNTMTFNEIIRTANQFGLLKGDLSVWDEFRQKRNMTFHTYDENIANQVVAVIPNFKEEAEFLLERLKKRI